MADDVAAGPEAAGAEVMAAMLDLSSPQANYKAVIDGPGFVQPAEGLVLDLRPRVDRTCAPAP